MGLAVAWYVTHSSWSVRAHRQTLHAGDPSHTQCTHMRAHLYFPQAAPHLALLGRNFAVQLYSFLGQVLLPLLGAVWQPGVHFLQLLQGRLCILLSAALHSQHGSDSK